MLYKRINQNNIVISHINRIMQHRVCGILYATLGYMPCSITFGIRNIKIKYQIILCQH